MNIIKRAFGELNQIFQDSFDKILSQLMTDTIFQVFYQTRPEKTVIKLSKGSLNNIFQDSFDKILSRQLTHDRSYISRISEVRINVTGVGDRPNNSRKNRAC